MTSRHDAWTATGEGAFFGAAVGLLLGAARVEARMEVLQGTPILAAWSLLRPVLAASVCCGALSLAVTPLLRTVATEGSRRDRSLALGTILALTAAWIASVAGPHRTAWIPIPTASRPKSVLAVIVLLACCGAALAAARALDLRARPPLRRTRTVLAITGIAGLVASALGAASLSAVETRRAAGRPSVLILCLDTMRADALGSLGGGDRTPFLDRLAAESVLFEQATAAAPWTLPSHVSLFTSRLPFDHGTRFSMNRISPSRLMLAERFREAGYRTGGFTGDAYVDSKFGFDQGFDRYEDFHEDIVSGPVPIANAALRWIRQSRERPFFAFVHTYEPHSPFTETLFAESADREGLPDIFDSPLVQKIHDGELVLSERQRRWVRDLYSGDVARADRIMGAMLEALRDDGILDRTILVVLSDHGEDLWDHDDRWSPGHGHSLYQELLHVPLFVRAPGVAAGGTRIHAPVSLLDVAPTLLDLCGLRTDERIHGRSLSETVRTGAEPAEVPVWAESVEYGPDRFALREGRWKVILTPGNREVHGGYHPTVPPLEVFDLQSDPRETVNLVDRPRDETQRLVRTLTERVTSKLAGKQDVGSPVDPDEELMETLRSLGYVR